MANVGVRSVDGFYSAPWANATRGVPGTGVYVAADESVDVAAAITNPPLGILMNDPAQYEHASVRLIGSGGIVRAVAGAAISIGDEVTVTTGGKFIAHTRANPQIATVNYGWGTCIKAATHDGDIFELLIGKEISTHA